MKQKKPRPKSLCQCEEECSQLRHRDPVTNEWRLGALLPYSTYRRHLLRKSTGQSLPGGALAPPPAPLPNTSGQASSTWLIRLAEIERSLSQVAHWHLRFAHTEQNAPFSYTFPPSSTNSAFSFSISDYDNGLFLTLESRVLEVWMALRSEGAVPSDEHQEVSAKTKKLIVELGSIKEKEWYRHRSHGRLVYNSGAQRICHQNVAERACRPLSLPLSIST